MKLGVLFPVAAIRHSARGPCGECSLLLKDEIRVVHHGWQCRVWEESEWQEFKAGWSHGIQIEETEKRFADRAQPAHFLHVL